MRPIPNRHCHLLGGVLPLAAIILCARGTNSVDARPADAVDPLESILRAGAADKGPYLRLRGDWNDDGREDLILSIPLQLYGNSGGVNQVYIQSPQGTLVEVGEVFGKLDQFAVERTIETTYFWTTLRVGGNQSTIGYYPLKDDALGEWKGLAIDPGDGGGAISQALVEVLGRAAREDSSRSTRLERGWITPSGWFWEPVNRKKNPQKDSEAPSASP